MKQNENLLPEKTQKNSTTVIAVRISIEMVTNLRVIAQKANRKVADEIRARLAHSMNMLDTVVDLESAIISENNSVTILNEKYMTCTPKI